MSPVGGLNTTMSQYLRDSLNSGDLRTSMSRRLEEQQEAALEAAQAAAPTSSAAVQSSSNPMAGNFAQRREDSCSKYVQATLDGFQKDSAMAASQKSNLFAVLDEVMAFAKSFRPAEVARIVNRSRDRKLYEEVEENNEEMREDLERKAAEAAAPESIPEASAPAPDLPDAAAEMALPREQAQYAAPVPLTGGTIDIKV